MVHLSVKDSGTLGILTLRGNLGELHAEELKTALSRGLNRVNRLIVNCEQVSSLDMICLKLLCTAFRVSRLMKKDLFLAGEQNDSFHRAVETFGHAQCPGSDEECEQGCLWKETDVSYSRGTSLCEDAVRPVERHEWEQGRFK